MNTARSVIYANNTHYIESFVFHDTRMIGNYKHKSLFNLAFIADPIVPTISCLPINPIQLLNSEYLVTFQLPHNLLGKSEIRIDFEEYDLTAALTCTSTTNSMLTGAV